MSETTRLHRLQLELEEATARVEIIRRKLKAARAEVVPAEPTSPWLAVEVQYEENGAWYMYLILHVPGRGYYTTGVKGENSYFATWADLWRYFNSEDIHQRGTISRIVDGGSVYARRGPL